jgi:hypothetical protein
LLLEEHAATPSVAKKLSELQSGAVAAMVASATLTADETSELAIIAVGVQWASEADVNRVLAAFTVQPSLPPGKRRRSQQDYTKAHHFLTARMWEAMLDPQTPSDVKLTALLGHFVKLGLRCPSEPTIKWLTSLWLVSSTDPVELGRMGVTDKTIRLKNTKVHFNSMRQRATDPPEWVGVLPSNPVDMLRNYPLVFAAAFAGGASPAPPGVSMEMISAFDMTYSCRGGLATLPMSFGGSPGQPTPSLASSSSSTSVDLSNMIMGFMQSMQANQHQMVQLMINPNMSPRSATSLASLEDRSYRQQGGLMGFQPEISRSRSTPLFEEIVDSSSPAKCATPLADRAAVSRETDLPETSTLANADEIALGFRAPSVAAGIDELFAMMQNRKEESKVKAQEAKTAKAQEAKAAKAAADLESGVSTAAASSVALKLEKANGKGKPVKKEAVAAAGDVAIAAAPPVAPKPAKAKGKGKPVKKDAVAAAGDGAIAAAPPVAPKPAKAKGKGKMVKVEAVIEAAEVAGDPSSKELSEVDKLRLAKAKLNAKNGKIRKLKASDGWGCAKCRWRFSGCAQCKGKTFTGFVWNPLMTV